MGNLVASGVSAPHSPSTQLRLRRGKKSAGCPCFLSEQASLWEALTLHEKFRPYVLRHLLDEGFICSVLEYGERENALGACEGVLYFKYMEESQRGRLREKVEAWERAAGAGLTACEGLNSESAFGELQLARPLHAYGFLPTLQRRLAVLRELGLAIADEHRSSCRPFHMRVRSPPPSAGGTEQGDVRLSLMMNAVALQSLSTLASLATALQALPALDGSGSGQKNVHLIRAPFAMLADMLEDFPDQSLFKYWSPPPSHPERRVPVDPDTATASCSASSARLAVTGGLHVGWKSSATGPSVVTWQVALAEPVTELTSVKVQWGAGDPGSGTDHNALPLALSIEASVDDGKEWHGITGGDEVVDVALAHKKSPGSSQHRYPVSLLTLRRKREPQRKKKEVETAPAVTHIRLKMKGAPASRSGGALRIYDVSINERDPSASPSDVMTVLHQVQAFLLAQHSQDQVDLREYILRALLGVCRASCALEFELDLVRVYMQMECSRKTSDLEEGGAVPGRESNAAKDVVEKEAKAHCSERKDGLDEFVSTLLAAANRARRLAYRQDRERVIRDAGFDLDLSSKWVVISEDGQLVSSADSGHSHSLVRQCLRRGTWSWELALERESSGDETTCVGVAVNPVTNSCYEDSHQMWMVRCYSGETYSNGGRRNHVACKIHPQDVVRMTLNCEAGTLSLEVNGVDQGVVFSNIPRGVHPAVCFYGITKSVRLVELKRVYSDSDSDASESDDESDGVSPEGSPEGSPKGSPKGSPDSHEVKPNFTDDTKQLKVGKGAIVVQDTKNWNGARVDADDRQSSRHRRAARRAEEEQVTASIRAATAESPSTGLLASLANFAQWYVPRGEETSEEVGQHVATNQRTDFEANPDELAGRVPDVGGYGCWSFARRGDPLNLEAQGLYGLDNQASTNDRLRHLGSGGSHSNRLRRMVVGWPLPPARIPPSSSARPGVVYGRHPFGHGDLGEPRRTGPRVSAAPTVTDTLGAAATSATCGHASKGKRLPLEEPYIIQPTAAVFQKLYDILLCSLAHLKSTSSDSAASAVLSILNIMRANLCRLVDAHVDPAEVGLTLDDERQQNQLDKSTAESPSCDGGNRLLTKIFRCLQDIMLQEDDPLLRRATVDTFSSGLPLLMPRVEDRLHLLLGLVSHLQCQRIDHRDMTQWTGTDGVPPTEDLVETDTGRAALIPRERVTLLWNLLKHLARTESVLQLLNLFEEEEEERTVVSDLLELMLTSMADKTCPPPATAEKDSPGCETHKTYWEHLVASGSGGTTLNFNLLETCQQHLLYKVLNHDRADDRAEGSPHELLLCRYGQCLLQVCCRVLGAEEVQASTMTDWSDHDDDDDDPWWQLVGVLLPPFLHGLCLCADVPRVAEGILPSLASALASLIAQARNVLVCLSQVLSRRIRENSEETAVASMAEKILRQTQLTNPEEGLALAPSGWHPVRASFEVDKDSMTSFAISDDGQLYSALTSSNTCALVDVGVSQGKAAWEFLLEEDSPGDECSVFGIATKPPYSRCYNSSQSLWMRRAYNGVLYNRGRQLPVSQSMPKIHPGDVVRCQVDMDEGTVRFSVNGEKQDGGFDGIEGEVFPCAGSYRSGVTIRLLKMEIMGGIGPRRGGDDDGLGAAAWNPTEISWVPSPCSKVTRGGLVSIDKKAIEVKRMNTPCVLHQAWTPRPRSRSDVASGSGHSQPLAASADEFPPIAGALGNGSPSRSDTQVVAGEVTDRETSSTRIADSEECDDILEVADPEAWDWVSVRATRGFGPLDGKHSVEMEVTPVGTGRRRTAGTSRKGGSDKRNSLRRYPMAFGLCAVSALAHERPVGVTDGSWGWWTDGSLRAHGEVLIPSMRGKTSSDEAFTEELYGADFLPLKPYDVITMVVNTLEGIVSYLVNGINAGIAFGPQGSGAVCELPICETPFAWGEGQGAALFPACSLTNDKQVVQLRPGGTLGTQVWPLVLDLQKTVASLAGRLCATMIAGTPQEEAEIALEPWLRSPLLSGGEQASRRSTGESVKQGLGGRSWSEVSMTEQKGRLNRSCSLMAWGSSGLGATCDGALDNHHPRTVAEDGFIASQQQRRRSLFQLTVRIVRAAELPRGLVLWPDSPCVRLTAAVDCHDVDTHEEILQTNTATNTEAVSSKSSSASTPKSPAATNVNKRQGTPPLDQANAEVITEASQVLAGHAAHVLLLELPIPDTRNVDGSVQWDGSLSSVCLRLEVLVGRVVTAKGEVDLKELVQASLAELESSNRQTTGRSTTSTVKLSGGGEVVLALDMIRATPSVVESVGDTVGSGKRERDRDVKTSSQVDASETCSAPECDRVTRMENFLRGVASYATTAVAVDGDNREISALMDGGHQATGSSSTIRLGSASVGPRNWNDTGNSANTGTNTGMNITEALGSGVGRHESAFYELTSWLGLSHPDPPFLRAALEKTGNYSFPQVEAPFVAALLKHGGLVGEALKVAEMGEMPKRDKEGCGTSSLPAPSKDMTKLWGRVRQLRAYLRTQKQQYKVLVADRVPSGQGADGSGVASPVRAVHDGEDGGKSAEEMIQGNEKEAEEKREEPHDESKRSSGDVDEEDYPATFADLCLQMTDRANFLLELAPSTIQSPAAAVEGTCVLMRHLAEELPDLPTSSPVRLRSRLLRWRSEDRGKEPWKDVLRVQSQLRRNSSVIHRPRARSLGNRPTGAAGEIAFSGSSTSERRVSNPCIRGIQEDQAEDQAVGDEVAGDALKIHKIKVAPTLSGYNSGSLGEVELDSGYNSGDDSDDCDSGKALVDVETASSAAMQACTLYITTGGAVAPPRVLKSTLRGRSTRAAMRRFGLEALAALLRTLAPDGQAIMSTGAPSAVHEALIFLRPAFQGVRVEGTKGGKDYAWDGREVGLTDDERDSRHHYLKELEGCSAGLLADVQAAFEDLYGLLRSLLDHSLGTGQPGLAHVLLTSWALDFESRDYRFLAHESGILPTLQAMVSLTNTASMASMASSSLAESTETPRQLSSGHQGWTPWSLESIRQGFIQGTLLARDLARHISVIPSSALPSGFLKDAGLDGSPDEILRRHSMASLTRRYSALLRVHLHYSGANLEKLEQEAALERKRLEDTARERVAQMVERGVPVLDERETRKAPEVHLTALCSWATVPIVESVACTFARGVTYACTTESESPAALTPSTNTGNYFEVTVMNPGEKTTIGVGLANPDVFPPTKQMPGWVDHSYGYHGDDGRKFGGGKTESIWPTWVDGDIIGCGFDPVRGAIWYTRNGKLLGDGFVPIYESNLVPVVGFHSNGESVRVNFGVAPFAYEGPEVVVCPAVLAERELLKQEAQDANHKNKYAEKAEEKTEVDLAEAKESSDDDIADAATVEQAASQTSVYAGGKLPAEAMIPSLKVLQRGALSLLRFLVAVSMRQASFSIPSGSEAPAAHGSSGDTRNRGEDGEGGSSIKKGRKREGTITAMVPKAGRKADGEATASTSAVMPIPPTRERSMYGTPLEEMRMHVDNLHQDIFDLILRELRLGAMSLEHIAGIMSDRANAADAKTSKASKAPEKSAFDVYLELSRATRFAASGGDANQEMQRSYSHGYSRPAARGWASRWRGIMWKRQTKGEDEDDAAKGVGERANSTAESLGLQALETGEVEPHIFRLLALLCSVRQYAVARSQLAHPSSLRSIFSLLKVGSPRIQRCVVLLLGTLLPNLEPAVVDQCLHQGTSAWVGPDHESSASGASGKPGKGGKGGRKERGGQKDHPENGGGGRSSSGNSSDGLVGALFATVRKAYSSPLALRGNTAHERLESAAADSTSISTHRGKEGAGTSDFIKKQQQRDKNNGDALLRPGCERGYGGGTLELCLAEQSAWLLRELYKAPAWKELIARKLLLSIRTVAFAIRETVCEATRGASPGAVGVGGGSSSDSPSPWTPPVLEDVVNDAVAALAVIAGSSGVLYPGATVQAKSGAVGTVVRFSAGDAEASVVFDDENVEGCESIPVKDLNVVRAGFEADPDTPAQPVVAQLLSLLGVLLRSDEVVQALEKAGLEVLDSGIPATMWSRLLSQTLMAVLHLSMHCSDALVAACQEGDAHAGAHVLPALLEVAVRPVKLPALITAQELGSRWRAAQSRMLSALRMGQDGIRTLQPMQRRPLPPPALSPVSVKLKDKESNASGKAAASRERRTQSPPGGRDVLRDALSTEESREEALLRPLRHADYPDPVLEVTRPSWQGGRGSIMTLGDAHRTWGRGWGAAMSGRRAIGARTSLDWMVRAARDGEGEGEEEDPRRGAVQHRRTSRPRSMRTDLEHAMTARGRRAASAEGRRDTRRTPRIFHDHDRLDRLGGFAETRDERDDESGALLVEFNDGTDEAGRETNDGTVEAGSAGSADSADTSQDGEVVEEEINTTSVGAIGVDQVVDTGSTSRPGSPDLRHLRHLPNLPHPAYYTPGGADDQVGAGTKASTAFPICHVLEYDGEARAERQALGSRLSSELGVSEGTALSAIEAFGGDDARARQWLEASTQPQQIDTPRTTGRGLVDKVDKVDEGAFDDHDDRDTNAGRAASIRESAIVASLIGARSDGYGAMEHTAAGGEAAIIPPGEEGLHLWEAEGEGGGTRAPVVNVTQPSIQSHAVLLLCEHDLKPVLGFPRTTSGVVGPSGTVTTSFLVREADVLVPSSLVMITAAEAEGYAPDESCLCATVASEMDGSLVSGRGGELTGGNGAVTRGQRNITDNTDDKNDPEGRAEARNKHAPDSSNNGCVEEDLCPSPDSPSMITSIMDGEEVLVEIMDAETGLCLGRRVPIGELRHSTSFFGRDLDFAGITVQQLLHETDVALSVLRARSFLVRLIHSLPTPAIAASGGPAGLLNITRLLAAQDLAKGIAPASIGSSVLNGLDGVSGDGTGVDQSHLGSVGGDEDHSHSHSHGHSNSVLIERDRKLVTSPQPDGESLLQVLWRKVLDSPEQWMSSRDETAGRAVLGEMLAQEVLDSFHVLTTTPDTMLSGDWHPREACDTFDRDPRLADSGILTMKLERESIVHESLHPVCTPLSYGGHIKVDPSSHGMVVKLDSRSRTSSEHVRLQFFSTKEDMLNEHDPVRVMHNYVPERAARARAKGLEFFKIEEAESASPEPSAASMKDALSLGALDRLDRLNRLDRLDRLALPPALARQSSTSTTASLGSPIPLGQASSSRRSALTSPAMTRAMHEVHSQMMARRKARLKDSSAAVNHGDSFRSFSLPGVLELWFRFDAPPGADKPPIRITSLVGHLHFVPPGTIRASSGSRSGPGPGCSDARHRSGGGEDLTQEELGLRALFTFFGEENAIDDSLVAEASTKSSKRAGSEPEERLKPEVAELREERNYRELPACLAITSDVILTSGKWFYEATLDSLRETSVAVAADANSGDEGLCLLRIGWVQELGSSVKRPWDLNDIGSIWKLDEHSLAWETGGIGAGPTVEEDTEVGPVAPAGETAASTSTSTSRRDVHSQSGPLLRTGSWLSESVESSSPYEEQAQSVGYNSYNATEEARTMSTDQRSEGTDRPTDSESDELCRAEALAKGVVFPVVGSDAEHLGVGLGEEGFVWLGGRPKLRATRALSVSDVIGCAFDVDSGRAWFSVNGEWSGGDGEARGSACLWTARCEDGAAKGVRPCFSLRGNASLTINFGATPFKYPPPGPEFRSVTLRDIQVPKEQRSPLPEQVGESRVAFAPDVVANTNSSTNGSANPVRSPSKSNMPAGWNLPNDWGFRFVVDSLRGVQYRVVRELELICRFGGGSGSSAAAAGSSVVSQSSATVVSIWRPRATPGWFSVGDIASLGVLPPAGAVVVRADATSCLVSKPVKFRVVHQDKTTGYVVWRPVARSGQVSLGDFACAKKASRGIMANAVRCVAAWAVEPRPVIQCLWREEKQSGSQAIWSVENGLGTFFGSQTGGRFGKKEVTQGPQSRAERQKRQKKKKKKKKKPSLGGGRDRDRDRDSSDEEEGERVKVQHGVGEGWGLKGVSASCITNEWCQESDVVAGPLLFPQTSFFPSSSDPSSSLKPSGTNEEPDHKDADANADGDINEDLDTFHSRCAPDGDKQNSGVELACKPRPSVSWASWLLSFLLNHPRLRRLAMRASLFRTLVAYIRSRGAPHRLRVLPLLTLLVRSHGEFEGVPPPLEDLSGLLSAVLRECDKFTSGRGPGSAAWRPGDCPGGLQLETRWANSGLLMLTDLAIASRRAQDSLRQQIAQRSATQQELRQSELGDVADVAEVANEAVDKNASHKLPRGAVEGAVKVGVPPFGTRPEENSLEEGEGQEEGGQQEAEDMERSIAIDQLVVGDRTLGALRAVDRVMLEEDRRAAVLPDAEDCAPQGLNTPAVGDRDSQDAKPTVKSESPSRCLHHLLEVMDALHVLREGWPSPEATTNNNINSSPKTGSSQSPTYLDSLLCEAWMDAVGPAAVIESEHPFRKGSYTKTLHFDGAEEIVVFLDPRSSIQEGTASLILEGKDKVISLTGQEEAAWSDTITFRGDCITYRFRAEADGANGQSSSTGSSCIVDEDPQLDDWGFRFTVVGKGPVWEVKTFGGDLIDDEECYSAGCDATLPGSMSLLVELDQSYPKPVEFDIRVLGYRRMKDAQEDKQSIAGTFTDSNAQRAIYVRGDHVRIVPTRKRIGTDGAQDIPEFKWSDELKEPEAALEESDNLQHTSRRNSANGKGQGVRTIEPVPRVEAESKGEGQGLSDADGMPDADAKLERLPSNTPVLRPWREAARLERRWYAARRGGHGDHDDHNRHDHNRHDHNHGVGFHGPGLSYTSNAATVDIADSDAESKDERESSNSSNGEGTMWPRPATLSDIISTALPVLTAASSDVSETQSRRTGDGSRDLADIPSALEGVRGVEPGESLAPDSRRSETTHATDALRSGAARQERVDGEEVRNERVSTGSYRPRAFAGVGGGNEGGKPASAPCRRCWGVKVRAGAMSRKARLKLYLEKRQSLEPKGPSLEETRQWMKAWTPEMDKSLLELLGAVGSKAEEVTSGRVTDTLNPWCCRLSRGEAKFQQQRLAAVPAASMHIRAAFLLRLNDRIQHILPVVDLSSKHEASLGWQLREMNHVILPHIKNAILEAALTVTQGPGDGVAVTLDNMKAMMSRDRGDRGQKDLASSQCVFAQAYRQLCDTDPKLLRTVWDGERVFQINFVGEDGVDAGGVFREGMSRMVEDLFSRDMDLFILCPNGRQAIGQNNEKFVPNPHHSSPLAFSMLRFVGRLMGLSLRTRLCLPFQLPGMIWKRMVGLRVDFEDLRLMDTIICQFLTAIRACEDDGLTSDDLFRDKYGERLFFTYTGSDGVERELTPGGARRRVTLHNRSAFCRMVQHARAHEFDAQAAAMADGLSDIVPMKALRLFTASQLEIAVAGEPEFDIAFWKERTDYKGYRADDNTVELFWKVMESLSREDQSGFVRFAWGRSRLPPKAFWRVNMKLLRRNTTEDSLPVSHTCFFSVELPPYTTEERMRKGLLTAIHFGMGGILNA